MYNFLENRTLIITRLNVLECTNGIETASHGRDSKPQILNTCFE